MTSKTGAGHAVTAFPTGAERLALQASLLDGDRAIEAWRKLPGLGGPETAGVAWIAPLLMENIRRLLPDDPWIKGHPHFLTLALLQGRAMTKSAEDILRSLTEASIPTLALKGLALGAWVYESPGLRPVTDLDILVGGKDAFRAMEALKQHGLRSGPGEPAQPTDLRENHAHGFYPRKKHELNIDLHWHVLASARGDEDDTAFWQEAQPLLVGGARTLRLCAEDQLLHVLVHGVRWTRMPHVRWVADAVLLLRKTKDEFRVQRFLDSTLRYDAVVPVQEGLGFVADLCGEGRELFERSRALKRSRFAQRAFQARATSYQDRSIADRIALRIETAGWTQRARRRAGKTGNS